MSFSSDFTAWSRDNKTINASTFLKHTAILLSLVKCKPQSRSLSFRRHVLEKQHRHIGGQRILRILTLWASVEDGFTVLTQIKIDSWACSSCQDVNFLTLWLKVTHQATYSIYLKRQSVYWRKLIWFSKLSTLEKKYLFC